MAELKTQPTGVDPRGYIASVEHPVRRADAELLLGLLGDASEQEPRMWGPSIIGYGSYHYRYASGHEGDACAIGFSPRKANLALYGLLHASEAAGLLPRLGKHRTGAGCLYINKLADVDLDVLSDLARQGYRHAVAELGSGNS
jgi:hypothetical protein